MAIVKFQIYTKTPSHPQRKDYKMKNKEEVVKEMQLVVEQMRLDDIEENPDCENEFFTCAACGDTKSLAGSVHYGQNYRLCNAMEDKRLEADCEFLKQEQKRLEN